MNKMGLLQKAQLLDKAKQLAAQERPKLVAKDVVDSKFAKKVPGTADQYTCIACKGVRLADTIAALKHFNQSLEHK